MKAVNHTGIFDATTHYYLAGGSVVEARNGSDQVLQQYVHGLTYVDELVQLSVNSDPDGNAYSCDESFYYLQDANFNVLAVTDSAGNFVERYEYSAYGQRQDFFSPGSNDPGCYAPIGQSQVCNTLGTRFNAFGHQGLMHDEETGLVYNRARMLHAGLGRFMQQDPLGYADGMNDIADEAANPINSVDPGVSISTKCMEAIAEATQIALEKLLPEIAKFDPVADAKGGPTWAPNGHKKKISQIKNQLREAIDKVKTQCLDNDNNCPPGIADWERQYVTTNIEWLDGLAKFSLPYPPPMATPTSIADYLPNWRPQTYNNISYGVAAVGLAPLAIYGAVVAAPAIGGVLIPSGAAAEAAPTVGAQFAP